MGLVAAADMEVGLVAAKTELEVWLVWKEAGKDVGWVSVHVVRNRVIGDSRKRSAQEEAQNPLFVRSNHCCQAYERCCYDLKCLDTV